MRLSEEERAYLAMHARYESKRQEDFRYWDHDPAERERLRKRWMEIADWFITGKEDDAQGQV